MVEKQDSASGKSSYAARSVVFVSKDEKTGLSIYSFLNSSGKVLIISIQALGAGDCVDKGDRVDILFTNGKRLELQNTNDFNCDGSSTLYFGGGLGKHDELGMLASVPIETMRVWTRADYHQEDIPSKQATELLKTWKCLSGLMKK